MDHELKQRLIGAVVVTALCAIFIPMLFDDPVDNSSQVVSELSIPAPTDTSADTVGKLPTNAEQVLKSQDLEPLSTETAGDTLESTGAAEEVEEEPEAGQAKQGRSGESLYAESEGYTNAEKPVEPTKSRQKQASAEQSLPAAHASRLRPVDETDKNIAPKAQVRDTHAETATKEAAKIKKAAEMAKSTTATDGGSVAMGTTARMQELPVKKLENESPATARNSGTKAGALDEASAPAHGPRLRPVDEAARQTTVKSPDTAKSLAVAVAEAKKPATATDGGSVAIGTTARMRPVAPKANVKLVRWYIQLGSFSKKENAMSLWDSLREQGVPASLDTIETDKGTAYRLRVGPELDGKKAAAMKSRLDKQNIKAILMSE
jgi:DedD protein